MRLNIFFVCIFSLLFSLPATAEKLATLICKYDEPLLVGGDCYNAGSKSAPAWKRNCFSSCRKPRKVGEINCEPPITLECPEKNAVKTSCSSTSFQTKQACETRSTLADACARCVGTPEATKCVNYEKTVECTNTATATATPALY